MVCPGMVRRKFTGRLENLAGRVYDGPPWGVLQVRPSKFFPWGPVWRIRTPLAIINC